MVTLYLTLEKKNHCACVWILSDVDDTDDNSGDGQEVEVLLVTISLNDVNIRRFSRGMIIKLHVERRSAHLLRVTNEEREQLPHLEWASGGSGVAAGGHFEHCSIDDVSSNVGWWDEQNMVSYGDDDILFSVFLFQASHFAFDKAHYCCLLNPAKACN